MILKRLKRAYEAFKEPETEGFKWSGFVQPVDQKGVEMRTVLKGNFLPGTDALGDGKAEFLPDMTEEEMLKYEHEEVQGWAKVKRALGL